MELDKTSLTIFKNDANYFPLTSTTLTRLTFTSIVEKFLVTITSTKDLRNCHIKWPICWLINQFKLCHNNNHIPLENQKPCHQVFQEEPNTWATEHLKPPHKKISEANQNIKGARLKIYIYKLTARNRNSTSLLIKSGICKFILRKH